MVDMKLITKLPKLAQNFVIDQKNEIENFSIDKIYLFSQRMIFLQSGFFRGDTISNKIWNTQLKRIQESTQP